MPGHPRPNRSQSSRLRLGLIQCGHVPTSLIPAHGDYPEVFTALLGPHEIDVVTYDVQVGPVPPNPRDCDGWLISGSASSAYEPLEWIGSLESFLRRLVDTHAPTVAICFGHQAVAQAMGGTVAKAPAGWGVGAHDYELLGPSQPWMVPPPGGRVRWIASHQDQVVELPDGAEVLAHTEHCPIAAYTLGDRLLAIQPHPEFTAALSTDLIELRRAGLGEDIASAGLASLRQPVDQELAAGWINAFLRQ